MSDLVVFHDSFEDPNLTDQWVRAFALDPNAHVFQGLDWARLWTRHYPDFNSLNILVETCEGGIFLLPLMDYAGTCRSLTYNSSDYTGCIFGQTGPTRMADCQPSLIAEWLVRRSRLMPVKLWNVRVDDPVVAILRASGHLRDDQSDIVRILDLDEVRSDLDRWVRQSTTRRQAFDDGKRLLKLGAKFEFDVSVDDHLFKQMVGLHTRTWKARGERGKFKDKRRVDLVRELVLTKTNLITSVSTLTMDERLVAYYLGFHDGNGFSLWNSGYHPDYRRFGPGMALLLRLILELATGSRFAEFNFLRGDEAYKRSYSSRSEAVYTFTVEPEPRIE